MHPAFSVILFTTLSGAGYGLLAWCAFAALWGPARPATLLAGLAIALVLVTVGLLSSLAHLGKPARAWRAFSQWRTSWLSREGVLALVTYVPALLLGSALLPGMIGPEATGAPVALNAPGMAIAVALAVSALVTVACTAMIYASLKPVPAWRHGLVVPGYLLFSLLTGGLLFATVQAITGTIGSGVAIAAAAACVALAVLKQRYWRDIDGTPLPQARADAVGLPGRDVSVFERPHTQGNYLTREMGFVLARRHSRRLRAIALLLFAVLPAVLVLPVWLPVQLGAAPWLAAAAASALLGALVERWLFFAEARHLVTLYY